MGKWIKNPTKAQAAQFAAEASAKREALVNILKNGVASIQSGEDFKTWLQWQSKFYQYSFGNMMLIGLQRPKATVVHGYKTWIELGRVPLAGRSITIRAPQTYNKKEKDGTPIDGEVGITFKAVAVWDIADTTGDSVQPTLWNGGTVGEEGEDLYLALQRYARGAGIKWSELQDDTAGAYYVEEHRVNVVPASPTAMFEIAAHETAHALDPERTTSGKPAKETVAEGVAFEVCHHFGIDTSESAFAYIAVWSAMSNGPALIQAVGNRIQKIAETIIDGIERELKAAVREEIAA